MAALTPKTHAYLPRPADKVLGITHPSPRETNIERGLDPEQPIRLEAYPRQGKLYLFGVRAFYEPGDDIRIRILHPKDGGVLNPNPSYPPEDDSGFVPGYLFDAGHDVTRSRMPCHEDLFVLLAGRHEPDNVEPVYASAYFPLIVEARGSASFNLSIVGCDHYRVVTDDDEHRGPYGQVVGDPGKSGASVHDPYAFYDSLEEGAIVHYHHSFGRFIRCEVVTDSRAILHYHHSFGRFIRCEVVTDSRCRALRMLALVGDWFDGPERSVYRERLGDVFCPDPGTIYENPAASVHDEGRPDPRGAEPTDVFSKSDADEDDDGD